MAWQICLKQHDVRPVDVPVHVDEFGSPHAGERCSEQKRRLKDATVEIVAMFLCVTTQSTWF
jgi:hypothetical protein